MKIGIFDSGVGGKSFIPAIRKAFPDCQIVYKDDKPHLPYGNKSPEELLEFTSPIFTQFEQEKCDILLVACNTVTTTIINQLRYLVSIPLIGVEPMIKPGAQHSKTGVIAVCATPTTLASNRYVELKKLYGQNIIIQEPDCSDWANMIEGNRSDELELSEMINDFKKNEVDTIVLACTHYHWIYDKLNKLSGEGIDILLPIDTVVEELKRTITNT